MVLALALGVVGTVVGGDLRLPEAVTTALSAYLLFAIGLKGGVARSAAEPAELVLPTLATLALVVLTSIVAFVAARRLLPIDRADAGGFFRAIGSVFDCLAAVAILTLQVPLKVRKAEATHLGSLGVGKKRRAAAVPTQLEARDQFDALVHRERAAPPAGWYEWSYARS